VARRRPRRVLIDDNRGEPPSQPARLAFRELRDEADRPATARRLTVAAAHDKGRSRSRHALVAPDAPRQGLKGQFPQPTGGFFVRAEIVAFIQGGSRKFDRQHERRESRLKRR
jgi:hypothetical protein